LGVGEPDFVTPWGVREAAIKSIRAGYTQYTSNMGLMELREEIAYYLESKYSVRYEPNGEIVVTVGASEAVDVALRALVGVGDEVLIPDPSYVSYSPCVTLCGGTPVPVRVTDETDFKMTAEALEASITSRSKVLLISYPNNPTGAVMNKKELSAIARVLKDTDIMVLSDEIYAELTYGGEHVSIASIDGMRERTVLVSGFSKAYAMTGWRLGYICAPEPLLSQMLKLHQYAIMCAPTASQHAAIEALRNCDERVAEMKEEYDNRRHLIVDGFRKLGLECREPLGAFYAFPCIKKTGLTSDEFCERLLNEGRVAIVPGTAFGPGGEGFARISYAYSVKHITEALKRMEKFISKLR
jgi:aminotransferase